MEYTNLYKKSKITLDEIRPYISSIHGYFGVPFGDIGFFDSLDAIKKNKEEYDEKFMSMAALILGVGKDSVKPRKEKNKSGEWCFRHNVSYSINIATAKKPSISITISENMNLHSIHFEGVFSETTGGNYYIGPEGEIYQNKKGKDYTLEEIINCIRKEKLDKLLSEIKKYENAIKNAEKSINTMKSKIANLNEQLLEINN